MKKQGLREVRGPSTATQGVRGTVGPQGGAACLHFLGLHQLPCAPVSWWGYCQPFLTTALLASRSHLKAEGDSDYYYLC